MTHLDVLEPDQIFDAALALAKADSGMALHPIRRSNLGFIYNQDMQTREAYMRSVSDYLDGETLAFVDMMPGETDLQDAQDRPGRLSIPKARRWLELWSSTYNEQPKRTYFKNGEEVEPELEEKINKRYEEAEADMVMQELDFNMRAQCNTIARPWFDQDNDELTIHTYESHSVRVVENYSNPRRPHATVLRGVRRGRDKEAWGRNIEVAEIWTSDTHAIVDDGKLISTDGLATTRPPLVHCFEKRPNVKEGYFSTCPGPLLVAINSILDNDYYTQAGYALLMQGIGTMQIFGSEPGKNLLIGPGRVLNFSGDPEKREGVEFASSGLNMDDWQTWIEFITTEIRESFGIPQSMLDVTTDASGAAIVQANGPTIEMRQSRQKHFQRIEREFLRATIDVLTNHDSDFPNGLNPDDFDVSVKYGDQRVSQSVQDKIAMDTHLLAMGATTHEEIFMRENPGKAKTLDDAREMMGPEVDPDVMAMAGTAITDAQGLAGPVEPAAVAVGAADDITPEGVQGADTSLAAAEAVQETSLNGAQITALQGIVEAVSDGLLPFQTALELILAGFPQLPRDQVLRILNPTKGFNPKPDDTIPPPTKEDDQA